MRRLAKRLFQEEAGVTSIEYAVLGSFIGLLIITAISTLGTNLSSSYTKIAAAFG